MEAALVNPRIAHLRFIQSTIHSYDAHGIVAKIAALLVTAGIFYAFLVLGTSKPGILSLAALGAGIILFVLWMIDAHYYQYKLAYSKLYDAARSKPETDFDMNVDAYKGAHAKEMWRAPVSWLYISLIGAVAFLSMMV